MYLTGKIKIISVIPEKLSKLKTIAYDLWWSWNSEAIDLYREIDLALWERLNKNPIRFLQEVSQRKLEQKLEDPAFMSRYELVVKRYENYLANKNTWFSRNYPDAKNFMVAYFSAEFGLNEVLPVYSGGLGILSGDHCKSASDLGIPFTGIGLFYKQGYFYQRINSSGWQETFYSDLDISHLPIMPVMDKNNKRVTISIDLPGRTVYAKVWRVKIGRVSLYLMDTDTEENSPADRELTSRLYGGDQETRIQQEIFLGIGGIRVLKALGINATVFHMNEGHSAFMGLELTRNLISEKQLSFSEAREVVAASTVFTTHTPVPAGNDVFPFQMIDKYFSNYWGKLGIGRHEFLDLGLKPGDHYNFNMTVLALNLAGKSNGVSELHGAVSRNIFSSIWPGIPEDEIPITHITNGIHTLTWMSPSIKYVYDKYLESGWQEKLYDPDVWKRIDEIPDEELWSVHCALKTKMIGFIRDKLREQRVKNGESIERIREVDTLLDSRALTIGFARRFATYKRANLIFRNAARIQKILNHPDMPVQIIFAGKAHPADRPAHEVIKNINDVASQEGFRGRVILVENYNMTLARNMLQGVDIWLNNPRRPLEASGTSGQKVCINGVINFSILDGWWCEGYNGKNGWVIGDGTYYSNEFSQDNSDSESIYSTLEDTIIPLYYSRDEHNIPVKWVKLMKESIKSLAANYSTHRMVQEYTESMYIPAVERVNWISSDNYSSAKQLSIWKEFISRNWPHVRISFDKSQNQLKDLKSLSGENLAVSTTVSLGEISPSDVKVEMYYGPADQDGILDDPQIAEMSVIEDLGDGNYRYGTTIRLFEGGDYSYTFRVIPFNNNLINKFELRSIKWVVQ